jgi:hypothetical protein
MIGQTFLLPRVLRASCLLVLCWFGLAGLSTVGCGGQTTPQSSSAGKDAACSELCQQSALCDDAVDLAACTQACADSDLVSRAGQELLTACTKGEDCAAIGSSEMLECIEGGLRELPITQGQEDFCAITLGRLADCRESPISDSDVDSCLGGVAVLSEELVTELNECGERTSCDLVNLCAGVQLLTVLDQEQLEIVLGGDLGDLGDLGGLGSLEDLLGSLGGSMGGAGPG